MFVDFLIIFSISLVQRLLVRLNESASYDSYGHLFFLRSLKEKNLGPFNAISTERLGVSGEFYHPFLLHWLLSFLPYSLLLKYQFVINPILDSIFSCFIYFILLLIGFTNYESMLIVVLYVFTPAMFTRLSIGPRTGSFTPRLFSEVIGNLFFLFLFLPLPLNYIESIAITSILASITMLSSKFGVQAILFITPIALLFSGNMNGAYAILISILICIVITKGKFIDIIFSQIKHLIEYFIRNINQGSNTLDRNNLKQLFDVIKSKNINAILYQIVAKNSFTATLIKMPVFPLFIVYAFFGNIDLVNDGGFDFFDTSPIYAATVLFFLINTPWLLFLGEAERYLNFVIIFILTGAFILLKDNESIWLLDILIIYGVFYSFVEIVVFGGIFGRFKVVGSSHRHLKTISDDLIISKFKTVKTPLRILSYPYNAAGGWRIVAETKHTIIYPIQWENKKKVAFRKYEGKYPYVKLSSIKGIIDDYGVNVIVVNKIKQQLNNEEINLPDEWYVDSEFSNELYDVFRT